MRGTLTLLKIGLIPAALILCCQGCGYRFAGSGDFPGGVATVFVAMFDNRTSSPGAESIITNSLVNEFSRRGGVIPVDRESAEAVLSGTVKSISTVTVSHAAPHTSAERRLVLLLEVRLSAPDNEILWAADDIRGTIVFAVADEGHVTDQSQAVALSQLAEEMAETVYNRLTENF